MLQHQFFPTHDGAQKTLKRMKWVEFLEIPNHPLEISHPIFSDSQSSSFSLEQLVDAPSALLKPHASPSIIDPKSS